MELFTTAIAARCVSDYSSTTNRLYSRKVWRYQRGNKNPDIEEEQKTRWSKVKEQKDKQRSTKQTHKTKDRVTRTPIKTGSKLRCSGRVGSSCSTSGTRRVNLVTNPVIGHEWGKHREVMYTETKYLLGCSLPRYCHLLRTIKLICVASPQNTQHKGI